MPTYAMVGKQPCDKDLIEAYEDYASPKYQKLVAKENIFRTNLMNLLPAPVPMGVLLKLVSDKKF